MERIVRIGDMAISNKIEDSIKTIALASCVGVVAYSPYKKVGGMIHYVLPSPTHTYDKVNDCCYYASTGIPYFINRMINGYGCSKGELTIQLYGGANSINRNDTFNVGRRNLDAARTILTEMNLRYDDSETGRNVSRTIQLSILTGIVEITYQNIRI